MSHKIEGFPNNENVPELKRESEPVTRFVIDTSRPIKVRDGDSEDTFTVYDIGMGRGLPDGAASYYALNNLSKTKKLEIVIAIKDVLKIVELPEAMLERIATFIQEDHKREGKFDCGSFVHFANGIDYEFSQFFIGKWDITDFDEQNMVSGDSIMISKDPEHMNVTHLAIYLGDGLYLSKFGVGGKLIATTMDEMKKGFAGQYAFKMRPNEKKEIEDIERMEVIKNRILEIDVEIEELTREMECFDQEFKLIPDSNETLVQRIDLLKEKGKVSERVLSLMEEESTLKIEMLSAGKFIMYDDNSDSNDKTENEK